MRDLRNCRCCGAVYEKPTDYWCVMSSPYLETKGFCEFCDRNNELWFIEKGTPNCKFKHE